MKGFVLCLLLGVVWPLSEAAAQRARVPPGQEAIAADLRSTESVTIDRGISGAFGIAPQQWTPALRRAILYALESEIRLDREAALAGVHRFDDDDLAAPLTRLAVVMQDPATIPLLAQVPGVGGGALVAFGRQALPEVIRVAKEGEYHDALRCLVVLRQTVQEWGVGYFTAQERAQLKAVAALYLSPRAPMIQRTGWSWVNRNHALQYAAQLAWVLEDAEAIGWIEAVATDAEAFEKKTGVQHSGTHKELQEILDGAPMLPRLQPLRAFLSSYRELYGRNWDQ